MHQDGQNTYYTHDGVSEIIKESDGSIATTKADGTNSLNQKARNQQPTGNDEYRSMVNILEEIAGYNSKSGQNQMSLAETDMETLREAEEESGYSSQRMTRASVATDQDGRRLFSMASMDHDKELYREMLVNSGILKADELDGLFQTIDRTMSIINKDRVILDMNESFGKDERSFLPVKPCIKLSKKSRMKFLKEAFLDFTAESPEDRLI